MCVYEEEGLRVFVVGATKCLFANLNAARTRNFSNAGVVCFGRRKTDRKNRSYDDKIGKDLLQKRIRYIGAEYFPHYGSLNPPNVKSLVFLNLGVLWPPPRGERKGVFVLMSPRGVCNGAGGFICHVTWYLFEKSRGGGFLTSGWTPWVMCLLGCGGGGRMPEFVSLPQAESISQRKAVFSPILASKNRP